MTRNKYAALSFILVTAARHDFGDGRRRKRNLPFHSYFGRWAAAPRLSSEEDDSTGFIMGHCRRRSGYMMPAAAPQSHPAYCFCHCCHVEPIFTSSPSSSSSLSTNFCARYTFKALNIIHYNAVHSRHLACGMRQVQNLHSPPLPPLQPSTDQVPL